MRFNEKENGMFPQDIVYMKYTRRNIKKPVQPNRRGTNKLYYNKISRLTRKKHGKRVKKVTGGNKIKYEVKVIPSSFLKIIPKYDKTAIDQTTIEKIKKKLLEYNLPLFNTIFKIKKEVEPSYYGAETEEIFSDLSAAANNLPRYDNKIYNMDFDYQGKTLTK